MYCYNAKIYAPTDNNRTETTSRRWVHPCYKLLELLVAAGQVRVVEVFKAGRWVPGDGSAAPGESSVILQYGEGKPHLHLQYYAPVKGSDNSIALLSMAEDDLQADPETLSRDMLNLVMHLTPPGGFAWMDHELALGQVEPALILARLQGDQGAFLTLPHISAWAWANIFPADTYAKLESSVRDAIKNAPWYTVLERQIPRPRSHTGLDTWLPARFHHPSQLCTAFLSNENPTVQPLGMEHELSMYFEGIPVRGIQARPIVINEAPKRKAVVESLS